MAGDEGGIKGEDREFETSASPLVLLTDGISPRP